MRHRIAAAACAALAVLCTFACTAAALIPSEDIDAILAAGAAEARIPAMAVVIVDSDGIVFEEVYGAGASADTPFILGSLSKSFTALCILQLEEDGLVGLDVPARTYIDTAPDGITVRQLLNQTGGIGTYQLPGSDHAELEPGEHVYSNLNYALLAQIVEQVSGLTYEEYLQKNILEPLDMRSTSSTEQGSTARGLVQGYENWFGLPVASGAHYPDAEDWIQPGAGYISSSAHDMGRYLQMYLRGGESILAPDDISRMFTESVAVEDSIPYTYGMGWTVIEDPLPVPVYRHSGLVETGMTCMFLLPTEGIGIVLLADMNDYLVGTDLMDRVGWNLVLNILGEQPGEIVPGEYWRAHALYDTAYAALIAVGVLYLCMAWRFRRRLCAEQVRHWAVRTVAAGFILPIFILLAPSLFLSTPLWVVHDFVPDLFSVLIVSSTFFFAGGILRVVWVLQTNALRRTQHAQP